MNVCFRLDWTKSSHLICRNASMPVDAAILRKAVSNCQIVGLGVSKYCSRD